MVDLTAPQPRLAPALFPNSPLSRKQSRPVAVVDDTFYSLPRPRALGSPPPLLSPYRVPEDGGIHNLSSKPPCSPTKRRRGLRNLPRTARHRHCGRSDCCINTFPRSLTSLDDLPWISSLSIEPDSANSWDIADLSFLDVPVDEECTGPGPVRRRKTSLRPNPLGHVSSRNEEPSQPCLPFMHLHQFADREPQTPPPRTRLVPSDVVFGGLYPVFPWDVEEPSGPDDVDASH
ncbi:hypothetical protein BD309DRAFT_848217 [Dichomitus squalens]|uniref:Uncharacterized protein n=1 Tax=Dichomitus squalens TaxID=114155 RepID=A0A4Q9PD05_9APHY|nr:uncharacterized protein DICSQDRAFT_132091 [Dichomitus squalens LYAD-421 SS1]EJF65904.1 hypothetical protein DICSQDRAFT_132091 [Dichomitus squalens LYAD-421 SS1]TBU50831.1 hypothetical protein BD309DRAFT_848217 [Dichomitus squalens]TBU65775.1 hypothetical protein BD310DRAFT_26083 [Dichomitus squalens]